MKANELMAKFKTLKSDIKTDANVGGPEMPWDCNILTGTDNEFLDQLIDLYKKEGLTLYNAHFHFGINSVLMHDEEIEHIYEEFQLLHELGHKEQGYDYWRINEGPVAEADAWGRARQWIKDEFFESFDRIAILAIASYCKRTQEGIEKATRLYTSCIKEKNS